MDITFKTQKRGAYTNHIGFTPEGVRVAIFRPTVDSDFVITVDGVQREGTYPTVAVAKKSLVS